VRARPYRVVDVFTAVPYRGNPVAVVLDGAGLDVAGMQRFAAWTNLSETTFLLPPSAAGADYRVRIFTPTRELPFAGHPTLGSCCAWLAAGGAPADAAQVVQECALGLVPIRRRGERLAFRAPPARAAVPDPGELDAALAALGLPRERLRRAQWLECGPRWLCLLVDSAETVLGLAPDNAAVARVGDIGVVGPHAAGEFDFEVRAFAAADNIPEDPVTGSLNAALAQWLVPLRVAPERYTVAQGTRLGRAGRVVVESADGDTWIGGDSVVCVAGTATL
jgi:PhzF family phenazine biosynthesis protein